jgi:hypothetical protein
MAGLNRAVPGPELEDSLHSADRSRELSRLLSQRQPVNAHLVLARPDLPRPLLQDFRRSESLNSQRMELLLPQLPRQELDSGDKAGAGINEQQPRQSVVGHCRKFVRSFTPGLPADDQSVCPQGVEDLAFLPAVFGRTELARQDEPCRFRVQSKVLVLHREPHLLKQVLRIRAGRRPYSDLGRPLQAAQHFQQHPGLLKLH